MSAESILRWAQDCQHYLRELNDKLALSELAREQTMREPLPNKTDRR